MSSSPSPEKVYFNCVVMGNEYLQPESTVAHHLTQHFNSISRKIASSTSSIPNNKSSKKSSASSAQPSKTIDLDCQFLVETTFAPKPYLLPISTEQLHCAIILFSPMRPLSFVRIDSFIDRVLHVPNIKIIILVVDVDILGSEAAIASLNETSRCRPVSRTDVKRYVKLKRRVLRRIDEYEQNAGQATFQSSASTFAMTSSFGGIGAASDNNSNSKIPIKKRELIVCIHQKNHLKRAVTAASSSISSYVQLFAALRWCFSKQFGDSVGKRVFDSSNNDSNKSSPLMKTPINNSDNSFGTFHDSSSSASDESDDHNSDEDDGDKDFIDKHEKEKQEEEDGVSFNDVAWPLEWEHQLHESKRFFRQQKSLFDSSSSSSSAASSSHQNVMKNWVMIPLRIQSSQNNENDDDDDENNSDQNDDRKSKLEELREIVSNYSGLASQNSSPMRRIGSAAFLLSQPRASRARASSLINNKNAATAHSSKKKADNIGQRNIDTEDDEPLRFAFWNPITNQVSLSIPKQIVGEMQIQKFFEDQKNKDDDNDDDKNDKHDDEYRNVAPPDDDSDYDDENDNNDDADSAHRRNNPQHHHADSLSPTLESFLSRRSRSYTIMNSENSTTTADKNTSITNYAACPPHQARKALVLAEKLREESYAIADKKMTATLQKLQETLTERDRTNNQLRTEFDEIKQRREELQLTRASIRERVYQTQKKTMSMKLALDRVSLLGNTTSFTNSSSKSSDASNNFVTSQEQIDELKDKLEILETIHTKSLNDWKNAEVKKQEREVEDYNRSGGKAELNRKYYAKFLENQQTRNGMNKIVEENDELEAQIQLVKREELQPVLNRKNALQGRKNQLLLEINDLLADDMTQEKNVNKFLTQVAYRRRKEERELGQRGYGSSFSSSDEDGESVSSSRSTSSLSSFDDSSSSSDEERRDDGKKSPRLFSTAISHLRKKLREIQQSFRFNPVPLLRPIGLCRSHSLHQVISVAQTTFEREVIANNTNDDAKQKPASYSLYHEDFSDSWIREFDRNSKQAISSLLRADDHITTSTNTEYSKNDISKSNAALRMEVIDRRIMMTIIEEIIKRQFLNHEEASSRMMMINVASLAHTRNLASKSMELAKAKRKALFRR